MNHWILIVFFGVHLLLAVYGVLAIGKVRCCAVQHVAILVARFKNIFPKRCANSDTFEKQVRDQLKKVRVTRARLSTQYMAAFFSMFVFSELLSVHIHWMRSDYEVETLPSLVADTYMFEAALVLSVFVTYVACPGMLGPRGLDACHVLLTATHIAHDCVYSDVLKNLHYVGTASCFRFMLALALGNMRLTVIMNLAYTLANTLIFAFNYGFARNDVIFQYLFLSATVMVASAVDSWMESDVRSTLKARLSSRSEATVRRLLSGVCDAVVQIGPDYTVSEPTPKLASLLLHTKPGALKDACFMDLVTHEGRACVLELLELEASNARAGNDLGESHVAPAVNCHMTGAYATEVPMEVFASAFFDLDGAVHYIVGVKENGDDARVVVQQHARAVIRDATEIIAPAERRIDHEGASSGTAGTVRDTSSHGGNSSEESTKDDGISVCVDVVKGGLPVRSSSRGFKLLTGSLNSAELDLKDWTLNGEEFEQWLLTTAGHHSAGGACPAFSATLQPPIMRARNTRVKTQVCLEGVEAPEETEETPGGSTRLVAHLKFTELNWLFGGRRQAVSVSSKLSRNPIASGDGAASHHADRLSL